MLSRLRACQPWLLAALVVAGIEVTYLVVARPNRVAMTNFLADPFCREDSVQRLMAFDKVRDFSSADPDILVLGDSSANHNVIPHVVMTQVPGFKVVTMGIATNVGYPGYLHLAEYMLRRNRNIKYIVLYNSLAGGQPRQWLWYGGHQLMADDIYNEFLHPGRRLLQVPTLAARHDVFTFVAYRNGSLRKYGYRSSNAGYHMFAATNRICYGWSRETDIPTDFPDNAFRNLPPNVPPVTVETFRDRWTGQETTYIDHIYGEFAKLARRHGVKLVLVCNPIPEGARTKFPHIFHLDKVEAALLRFRDNNPDVHVPAGIDYWPDDKFAVFSHVSTIHSEESALRLGRLLRQVIDKDGARPKERPADFLAREAPGRADINFNEPFCAFGWGPREVGPSGGWRYVGARDQAYLYTVVKADRDYRLRVEFHNIAAPQALERLKVRVNGAELAEVGRVWTGPYYVDLRLPREAASRYLGWLKVEFDIRATAGTAAAAARPETPGRKIAVRWVSISPEGG